MAIKRGVTKVPEETTTSTTGTTTPTNTTKTTTVNNSNILPEYQGAGVNKSNSYVNQGEGNYTYNEKTGFYEKTPTTTPTTATTTPEVRTGETKVTPTTTPTATSTPSEYQGTGAVKTGTTTTTHSIAQNIRDTWNAKSYAEQQELLKNNPNMLNELAKYGATPKEAEEEAKKEETPKKEERDYQDNSPERMKEIADNVNEFSITNPGLFADEDTFRNFFIDGKGRTPEQEKFLMDFYKNRKMYNKLDTYTSDQIGNMYVNGEIPDSYLTYLKNTDPERYNFVMDAKAKATDNITNQSEMDSLSYLSGDMDDKETMWGKMIEWAKREGLLVDKNGDLVDDRTYHEASEEEKTYAKEYSDNLARIMELQQTKRDMYDDYIKAYPGATKSTILGLVNDATTDIQKEIDNLTVENTRLQGYITYSQNERQEQDAAGKQTIAQLNDLYGIYYKTSPEGIRELAQAEYEATNVSLDNVENGTDTEKRFALDQILTDYYDRYGSIIQRPKSQVVMDIMDYATKNGVTLKEALQENFVKPLKTKPEYDIISSGGALTADKWSKLTDDMIYNTVTGEVKDISGGASTYTYGTGKSTITPISAVTNEATTKNLMGKYPNGSTYATGECGELMNLDASTAGSNIHFGSELSDKTKWINRETYEGPQIGNYVVFDWSEKPGASDAMKRYGHVGKIVDIKDGNIYIRNQNGSTAGKVSVDKYPLKDYENYIAGYVDPTKTENYGYWGSPMDAGFAELKGKGADKLNAEQKKGLDFATEAYPVMYDLAVSGDIDYFLRSPDGQKVLGNYESAQFSNDASYSRQAILDALRKGVTDQRILRIVNDLMGIIEKKLRWKSGAAISGSEWNSNSILLIPQARESYETQFRKFQTFEGGYLKAPIDSANQYLKTNVQYIPLFDGRSPYYTKYQQSAEQEADSAF